MSVKSQFLEKLPARQPDPASSASKTQADIAEFWSDFSASAIAVLQYLQTRAKLHKQEVQHRTLNMDIQP